MRQNGTIQVQDPSVSPTFALSRSASNHNPDVPSSLRRNLFASHMSRRPAETAPNVHVEHSPDPFQTMASTSNHIQPVRQHNQYAVNTNPQNVYEARTSPSRSLSPAKAQIYNTSSTSIIALDPVTGRPVLPVMPKLPPVLRDGIDEEKEVQEEEDEEEEDLHDEPWRSMKYRQRDYPSQHDSDMHSSSLVGMPPHQSQLHDLIDSTTGAAEYTDFEKIEGILSEMQALQKARARTATQADYASSLETPIDSGVSARTRGKARANTKSQLEPKKSVISPTKARIGGVGATLKPADKDELLGLIMTSLSKRVQEADEDAWMFGDERATANGVSVAGSFNYAIRDDISGAYD